MAKRAAPTESVSLSEMARVEWRSAFDVEKRSFTKSALEIRRGVMVKAGRMPDDSTVSTARTRVLEEMVLRPEQSTQKSGKASSVRSATARDSRSTSKP